MTINSTGGQADRPGQPQAVHAGAEVDVAENDTDAGIAFQDFDGLLRRNGEDDLVAEILEHRGCVQTQERFIFDDQNDGFGH